MPMAKISRISCSSSAATCRALPVPSHTRTLTVVTQWVPGQVQPLQCEALRQNLGERLCTRHPDGLSVRKGETSQPRP